MLNKVETEQSHLNARSYIRFMGDSIDEKISILEMLRENMSEFMYKLDTIEEIEEELEQKKRHDEQLLDDIH